MSIRFYCPTCDALIAFHQKHAGKHARCLSCGQVLIIPSKDNEVPQKIEPQPQTTRPLPGFYHALFLDTFKIFFRTENLTSLTFVLALVCFKFFIAWPMCCDLLTFLVVWACLLGFYLNIIYETAFGIDALPQIYLGTTINFAWNLIKPFIIFLYTAFIALLPFFIAAGILHNKGITFENILLPGLGLHSILQILFLLGLFLFPMAIITTAVGKDISLLRPDYLLAPILKAPIHYIAPVALLAAAVILQTKTIQYQPAPWIKTAAHLTLNIAAQIVAIIAMRSIGLFYRHHTCYIKW